MTALQRICLARSAYLKRQIVSGNGLRKKSLWATVKMPNEMLQNLTRHLNVLLTWGCWGSHHNWYRQGWGQPPWQYESFHLKGREIKGCINWNRKVGDQGKSWVVLYSYPSFPSIAMSELSLCRGWNSPPSSFSYSEHKRRIMSPLMLVSKNLLCFYSVC